jgi:exopolyphosphatase/guanosine-5'-triphosphate,3'-diphosphate pyrophosphatase
VQGRVDVIGGGALVWGEVLDRIEREAGVEEVVTSEHDILDGLAWSILASDLGGSRIGYGGAA